MAFLLQFSRPEIGKHMIFIPVINADTTTKSELVFIGLQLKTETIERILRPAILML